MFIQKARYMQKLEFTNENHTIPDVLLWRGRARYRPHFTDMQEPSGIERRDMAKRRTDNTMALLASVLSVLLLAIVLSVLLLAIVLSVLLLAIVLSVLLLAIVLSVFLLAIV
jgi:uncharacterized membrane protein